MTCGCDARGAATVLAGRRGDVTPKSAPAYWSSAWILAEPCDLGAVCRSERGRSVAYNAREERVPPAEKAVYTSYTPLTISRHASARQGRPVLREPAGQELGGAAGSAQSRSSAEDQGRAGHGEFPDQRLRRSGRRAPVSRSSEILQVATASVW